MANQFEMEMLSLMRRLVMAVESEPPKVESLKRTKKGMPLEKKRQEREERRKWLALVAIKNGASTLTAIAEELEMSRSTASRSEGVKEAFKMVQLESAAGLQVDQRQTDDLKWNS